MWTTGSVTDTDNIGKVIRSWIELDRRGQKMDIISHVFDVSPEPDVTAGRSVTAAADDRSILLYIIGPGLPQKGGQGPLSIHFAWAVHDPRWKSSCSWHGLCPSCTLGL
jgi:hypothetical protein